MVARSRLNVML